MGKEQNSTSPLRLLSFLSLMKVFAISSTRSLRLHLIRLPYSVIEKPASFTRASCCARSVRGILVWPKLETSEAFGNLEPGQGNSPGLSSPSDFFQGMPATKGVSETCGGS